MSDRDPIQAILDNIDRGAASGGRPHPLKQALSDAIDRLQGFMPARVVEPPDSQDGINLADDVLALAAIFDGVFEAYGHYAQSTLGISADERRGCFENVCLGAIDGHATHVLIEAGKMRERAE